MTQQELAKELHCAYSEAKEKVNAIYLFGIKYARKLESKNISIKELVRESNLPESYAQEIFKAMKLSRYVKLDKNKERDVPRPSKKEVEKYLKIWQDSKDMEHYRAQEKVIKRLFQEQFPKHDDINAVLIKVSILNDFYSTNVDKIKDGGTYKMAKHIVELDKRLNLTEKISSKDLAIVGEIAQIEGKQCYSFASKYCAHHNAEYPIYDSFVDKMLCHFNGEFSEFRKDDLKAYARFYEIIDEFKTHYGLEQYSLREIDIYLWLCGKEHFGRDGKKSRIEREV